MSHITPEPTTIIDDRKKRVVLVPLSLNRGFAKVDEEDYLAIREKGFTGGWYLNLQKTAGYVMVNDKAAGNNNKKVARLIMNPPPGYVVRYHNNDRKDLRRCNLVLQTRKALKAENQGKAHG
ncbi:hypothetical protein CU669_09225 [Paramagnetospirillum kuznetsovii]|uniref:Uncharacterized protein n=1 Tax=Paramagnetospirillum kuznetsovii TaxID=2053833 RepID=A0A364NYY6_9PROT|nr:hypothetical protein [Paramagnetospirillum kuznetsovii]RAU22294.1 hypothetical protein CU669_09225 [Paramagnetospirillum kuznetsovii]